VIRRKELKEAEGDWSSGAAYALGILNRVITLHLSCLALSPFAKVRQREYRTLLAPSAEPQADARWTTPRAIGSPAFMAPYAPRRGRRRIETMPSQNHEVRHAMVSGTIFANSWL
jgi:hypothetical protein